MTRLTPELLEAKAQAEDMFARSIEEDDMGSSEALLCRETASACRLAALALRYAEARHVAIGTAVLGSRDEYSAERSAMHAAQDALLDACREANNE